MDTSEAGLDADQKILDFVETAWGRMLDVSAVTFGAIETFSKAIRATTEGTEKPKLAVPASKEDCWKKARAFYAVYEHAREPCRLSKQRMSRSWTVSLKKLIFLTTSKALCAP